MEISHPKIEYNFPDSAYAPAPVSARNSINNVLSSNMNGLKYLGESTNTIIPIASDRLSWMDHPLFRIAQLASVAACAYHGYKRNNSVGWAIWWGICGGGVITPAIAIAQGFGKPIDKKAK